MLIIILIILLLIPFIVMRYLNPREIANKFSSCNVITYGKKGTGKDVIHNMVIKIRNDFHYSNIEYVPFNVKCPWLQTDVKPLNFLTVAPNTYDKFLTGDVEIIRKTFTERKDYYLSDGGIYLPSQYDNMLSKLFPSLPILYALPRHLANFNIHVNVQNLNRLWIKLREQADWYICCLKTVNLGLWLYTKTIHYENYDDALNRIKPIKKLLKGDVSKVAESARGDLHYRRYLIPKKWLTYDSRYFHRVLYGISAPTKKEVKKQLIDMRTQSKKCALQLAIMADGRTDDNNI